MPSDICCRCTLRFLQALPFVGGRCAVPSCYYQLRRSFAFRQSHGGLYPSDGHSIFKLLRKSPLIYSHWERSNAPLNGKNIYGLKTPFTHLDKGCRNAHPFLRFSKKNFYSVKISPHLFGITKPNDTLFHRKNEKIFFVLLRDDLFLLTEEKVPSLIPTGKGSIPTLFQKIFCCL